MSRIRTIKPEFWTSEQVVECSRDTRLLFIGLWNFCDDAGRHPVSARTIKMEVFPGDDLTAENILGMIEELSENGLIHIYSVGGKRYLQITGWHHQRIDKAQKARHPGPDEDDSKNDRGTFDALSDQHILSDQEDSPPSLASLVRHPPEGVADNDPVADDDAECAFTANVDPPNRVNGTRHDPLPAPPPTPPPTEADDAPAEPPAAPAEPDAKPKRRRQFPADWRPGPAGYAYARAHLAEWAGYALDDAEIDRHVAACIDTHRSRGNTFADLDAAWRTWVRNVAKFERPPRAAGGAPYQPGGGRPGPRSSVDLAREIQAERRDEGGPDRGGRGGA